MGQEVAQQQSQVPALYDPASQITAEDIAFPRLYVAQPGHGFVINQTDGAAYGDLVLASSGDDSDAQVVYKYKEDPDLGVDGVLFHVLALRKSLSDDTTGKLRRFRIDDKAAPPTCWTVYTYFVSLPGIEEDIPVKWLTWKTGKAAAQTVNSKLAKTAAEKPSYANAFRLTTGRRHNPVEDYRWAVPRIKPVDADEDNIKLSEDLYALVHQNRQAVESTDNDPDL